MNEKIFDVVKMARIPRCGVGNQLFNLNTLFQMGYSGGKMVAMPKGVSKMVKDMFTERSMGLISSQWPSRVFDSTHELREENMIFEQDILRRNLRLVPPFLGGTFFQVTKSDPKGFFDAKSRESRVETPLVAVHMRGGDFARWNPAAILPTRYYLDAIKFARELLGSDSRVVIVTDDKSLNSYQAVKTEFNSFLVCSSQGVPVRSKERVRSDMAWLAQADLVVSSPSTFAIWGTILGNGKAIHSKDWLNRQAQLGDAFWQQTLEGGGAYYELVASI